ncbi:hypothetical protein MGYG_08852 [Nannizzia gypsea CBS 118893]|uniref:Phytanoyl-CoA dioxygenase n=1 Tax=Arthroderma gypseum (strain ATCC MYA-4604 / CBS 118893) TaxID=535722 RepID=E4V761_ARTGP|nr:hypothetical protein MGYG_08852 [Nannizzia gypsea CBS 118893]EFQ96927.1 hypothetical protein MGYG_08852 [Nannizzia gypsea CBS 118893]
MPAFPPPLDPSYEPSVTLERVPATAPIEGIVAVLKRDGGLILTDLVSREDLAAVHDELEPYLQQKKAESDAVYDLIPKQTSVVSGLTGKSPAIVRITESDALSRVVAAVLQRTCTATWEDRTEEFTIEPLLSNSMTFHISHGAPRQRLHRDDMIYGVYHGGGGKRGCSGYSLVDETMLGVMIAGTRTTRANGATMAIPGSHLWDHTRVPRTDEVCFAEMEPGSAFVFFGSTYHGAGSNAVPGQVRRVYGLFFCPGSHRQEENQFLAVPRSKIPGMSERMLSLLGYKKPETWLGIVNNGDPAANLQEVLTMANS